MAKFHVLVLLFLAVVFVTYVSARNIPTDQTKPSTGTSSNALALAPAENTENVVDTTANSPVANGDDDQKNFVKYGGIGGWAGIGGYAGVLPVFGGVGGIGGATGLGGLGGMGGVGGGVGIGGGVGTLP